MTGGAHDGHVRTGLSRGTLPGMARVALWPILLCALVLAGCGGGDEQAAPEPEIPSGLAQDLAGQADAIAAAYQAGDVCGAAQQADDLNQAVIDAINGGKIPAQFQETLQATANKLVDTINCPAPEEEEEEKDHKGKGKGKGNNDGDGETTTVLDTTTTTTVGGG